MIVRQLIMLTAALVLTCSVAFAGTAEDIVLLYTGDTRGNIEPCKS